MSRRYRAIAPRPPGDITTADAPPPSMPPSVKTLRLFEPREEYNFLPGPPARTPRPDDDDLFPETFDREIRNCCYLQGGRDIFNQLMYIDGVVAEFARHPGGPRREDQAAGLCRLNDRDQRVIPLDAHRLEWREKECPYWGSHPNARVRSFPSECRDCRGLSKVSLRAHIEATLALLHYRDWRADNRKRLVLVTHSKTFADLATKRVEELECLSCVVCDQSVPHMAVSDQMALEMWTEVCSGLTEWKDMGLEVMVWKIPFWLYPGKVKRSF